MRRTAVLAVALVLLVVGVVAGASPRHPLKENLRDRDARTPVVFIPGITGSKLRDRSTGKTIWGRAGNLFGPRDGGRTLALPLAATPAPGEDVEAYDIIERMTVFGVVRVGIYGPLIDTLVANGYVRGNLLAPRPEDTLLVFPYDWRYGNLEAARLLAERLEHLRHVRGEDVLRVTLICHSNAARIARWYVKYGDATLDAAEAGRGTRPDNVVVEKIVFAGTGQGGALPTLGVLDRGRRYAPAGRKIQPEYAFAIAGLFEALPVQRDDLFFDEEGRTLPVDLFDAANWQRFGWSIFGAEAQRRVARLGSNDAVLGRPADRLVWLEERLDRAQRIQAALLLDVPDDPRVRLYQVQSNYKPTASRALLRQKRDGNWETLTIRDRRLRNKPLLATLGTAPGDRHATRRSQDWLSPQEQRAIAGADYSIDAVHRTIFGNWEAQRRILEFLAE